MCHRFEHAGRSECRVDFTSSTMPDKTACSSVNENSIAHVEPKDRLPENIRTSGATVFDPIILLALFVFWIFCNPFFAVDRGSLIYVGRAMADLDPSGVGQDIMFLHDGQSQFTLFTPIFDWVAAALGAANATYVIAASAVVFSFFGAVVLGWGIAKGRAFYAAIIFTAALPAYYGGFKLFSYAEAAATPRPFAEAFVLCGLTALLKRRYALSFFLMIGAMLFHPIMGVAGVAIWILWMISVELKWALIVPAALLLALVAFLAEPAFFDKAFTLVDPEWRTILVERNPHLFPSLWLSGWMGSTFTRMATLLIAASLVSDSVRKLFLIVLAVGCIGLAVSYFVGDRLSFQLILEAQTWRMTWLIFAIGAAAAAICAVELCQRGGLARVVLALLTLAWVWAEYDGLAVLLSFTAIVVHYAIDPKDHPVRREILWGVLGSLAVLTILGLIRTFVSTPDIIAAAPPELASEARRTLSLQYDYTPLAALGIFVIAGLQRLNRLALGVATLIVGAFVAFHWDQRSQANKYFDAGPAADLDKIVASKPGEIYWIDGLRENWWWLHRPNWIASIQGAGIVFSRDLAVLFMHRVQRVLDTNLADESVLVPFKQPPTDEMLSITRENLEKFCSFPDAPAWIIAPFRAETVLAADIPAVEWTARVPQLDVYSKNGTYHWQGVSHYAVISCSK